MSAATEEWTLEHREEVGDFLVTYPGLNPRFPKSAFVKVRARGEGKGFAILLAHPRRGASGDDIWVSLTRLAGIKNNSPVEVTESSSARGTLYRLFHSGPKLAAFAGFVTATIATVISGVATIHYGLGEVPSGVAVAILIFQVAGLAAVFLGVLFSP